MSMLFGSKPTKQEEQAFVCEVPHSGRGRWSKGAEFPDSPSGVGARSYKALGHAVTPPSMNHPWRPAGSDPLDHAPPSLRLGWFDVEAHMRRTDVKRCVPEGESAL